jgi:hypothetical protein
MLTRRRSDNPHQVNWYVFYDDVHVSTIGERAGVPVDVDQWHWSCGFYLGLHPACIPASIDMVPGQRSRKHATASTPIGKPSYRKSPTAPSKNIGMTAQAEQR